MESITVFSSLLNSLISFVFFERLRRSKKKSYLNENFKFFFFFFGLYFLIIALIIEIFTKNPYYYFLILAASHFLLAIALAFLFSAFLHLRFGRKSQFYFWLFIFLGFTIAAVEAINTNPNITSFNDEAVFYSAYIYTIKGIFLGAGFLYPAFSLLRRAFISLDKLVARRSLIFSLSFFLWTLGGVLHSQYKEAIFFVLGDVTLILGSFLAGYILLEGEIKGR